MIEQMHHHHHDCHHATNAFVDLNGIPYLLAEYLDKYQFQQIDRSLIRSEILVDQSESMRAIIDINIDDIGKRASDGLPAVIGNNKKQHNLLEMITTNSQRFEHQLNVLRRGLIIRVNYQLENQRNKQVIRSMSEDLRINDRSYFIDINSKNIDDNAIVVNFSNTMVSTINEFTHGIDRMVLRITNVQMFYECVTNDPKMPRIKQSLMPGFGLPTTYGSEQDMYSYHQQMQNRHFMEYPDVCDSVIPPTWASFNRFYHFNEYGESIMLHTQEINDSYCKTMLLGAGTVNVNRAFIINPGHRIIFKFCIWKNDVTLFNNTRPIADALRVPISDNNHHHHDCHHPDHHYPINPDQETLIRLYRDLQFVNDRQNAIMNRMMLRIDELADQVSSLLPPVEDPDNPIDPPNPDTPDDTTPPDTEDPVIPPDNSGETTPPDGSGEETQQSM